MTTLKQLNQYAKECLECALPDSRSVNQHLNECGTCGEYQQKLEIFNQKLDEIKKISEKSEDEIHRDLHERFSRIANKEETKRVEEITGLLDATVILPEDERVKIVKARTDVLTDFPKYERDPIIKTMNKVTMEWDNDRKRTERNALFRATEHYPILKKMMVRDMFNKMLD